MKMIERSLFSTVHVFAENCRRRYTYSKRFVLFFSLYLKTVTNNMIYLSTGCIIFGLVTYCYYFSNRNVVVTMLQIYCICCRCLLSLSSIVLYKYLLVNIFCESSGTGVN